MLALNQLAEQLGHSKRHAAQLPALLLLLMPHPVYPK